MKRKLKKVGLILFLALAAIQFYQPDRNESSDIDIGKNFTNIYSVPSSVNVSFQNACYDCHSNNTKYLWYDYIQPASMFVEKHINNGKEELNFNEFGSYSNRKQQSKLEAISNVIKSGEMPLRSYALMHENAKLSQKQKQEIINWIGLITE